MRLQLRSSYQDLSMISFFAIFPNQVSMDASRRYTHIGWSRQTLQNHIITLIIWLFIVCLRVLGIQALKKKKIRERSSSARGGWSKGSGEVKKRRRDAKLNYQRYDEEDDLECAKILAFLSLDDGGCCPNLSCLPETEKEKFQYFLWRIAQ